MKKILLLLLLTFSFGSKAEVSVMFHPYDPTLETIAEHMRQAKHHIDIAMYNLDTSMESPIIQLFASEQVQRRVASGELIIRLIFEGYGAKTNQVIMGQFEDLGVDVRFLGSSKKVHHKFAVIDGGSADSVLITGSANWSLSSQKNYNENILFFENEPETASSYQNEFEFLWSLSKEFGKSRSTAVEPFTSQFYTSGIQSFFNTDNFKVSNQRLTQDKEIQGFTLTRQVVALIDQAETKIEIASTRIKLRPIYDALLRAAQRGVNIQIVVTMGEYQSRISRIESPLDNCDNSYTEKCSVGKNFTSHLASDNFDGHENVQVRIKFFHLNTGSHLSKQMHSKYILVDGKSLITGSFNWSYSAEYSHLENIVKIEGTRFSSLMKDYRSDFQKLWSLNRGLYSEVLDVIEDGSRNNTDVNCSLEAMTLDFHEIDHLLNTFYSQNLNCAGSAF